METNILKSNDHNRIIAIDVTKGIGFFLVVLGHLVSSTSKSSIVIFSFHMPLFFIMSGYLMPFECTKEKMVKRIVTLFCNYVFFCFIGFLVTIIIPPWRNSLTLKGIIYDVVFNTQPECIHVGQVWFLVSMIWATLFFFLFHLFIKNELIIFFFVTVVAFTSVLLSVFEVTKHLYGGGLPFKLLSGMSALVFIEIGYLSKKLKLIEKIVSIKTIYKVIMLFVGFASLVYMALLNGKVNIALGIYNNVILYYFTSLIGTFCILVLSTCIKGVVARIIGNYGKNSLCLFSVHSFYLYAYAGILTLIFNKRYAIMENLTLVQSIIGAFLIISLIIPFEKVYSLVLSVVGRNIKKTEKSVEFN